MLNTPNPLNAPQSQAWRLEKNTHHYRRLVPTKKGWQGYADQYGLDNGLTIGRGCFEHQGAHSEDPTPFTCHVGLHIVLEAGYTLHSTGLAQPIDIAQAQVWRRQGDLGSVSDVFGHGTGKTKVVKLDFSPDLIARWHEDFDVPSWLLTDQQQEGLSELHHLGQHKVLMASAAQLLHQRADTLADRLALEGMALTLCATLCRLPEQSAQAGRNKIDDAIDWIRQHYQSDLTINILARAVGLNECYLKKQFKETTGLTIGQYVRDLRMQQAMDMLLHQGRSLKETAYYVGYRDARHFAKVFTETFGLRPNEVVDA